MKMIVRFLLPAALLFAVAGPIAVSCRKGDGEEDIEVASSARLPRIVPNVSPSYNNDITIQTDGTTISLTSSGYSFFVVAGAITFQRFTCYLSLDEAFAFTNECNLKLDGSSTFTLINGGVFSGRHITLSGSGSIKFIERTVSETHYNKLFSAAEGYTLTSSGKQEEANGRQSITFKVRKTI